MGDFIKWLVHEDQKELYGVFVAILLTIVFLALIALLLWPLDKMMMALSLAKGYLLFWIIISVVALGLNTVRKILRVNQDSHVSAYVVSNVLASGLMQVGWSAFAALIVYSFVAATPFWSVLILYFIALLSCFIAYNIVSSLYGGHVYRIINLPLAFVSFIIFSVWPASAHLTYGRFFDLF